MAARRGFLCFSLGQECFALPLLQSVMEICNSSFESPACTEFVTDNAQLCA